MSWPVIWGIALGLAMDAFAVSIAAGLTLPKVTHRHVFRLSWHFGFFQAIMPIIGWALGQTFAEYIKQYDHWVAFGLLVGLGGKMLYEAIWGDSDRPRKDPTRGWTLLILSIATSIDALAVGLSLALLGVSIWMPALIIGLVAAALTCVGIVFGSRLGSRWQHWAEILGGLVLIGIGVRILVEHLS